MINQTNVLKVGGFCSRLFENSIASVYSHTCLSLMPDVGGLFEKCLMYLLVGICVLCFLALSYSWPLFFLSPFRGFHCNCLYVWIRIHVLPPCLLLVVYLKGIWMYLLVCNCVVCTAFSIFFILMVYVSVFM